MEVGAIELATLLSAVVLNRVGFCMRKSSYHRVIDLLVCLSMRPLTKMSGSCQSTDNKCGTKGSDASYNRDNSNH